MEVRWTLSENVLLDCGDLSTVCCFSCGGNLLMDVGPTHDGRIVPVFEERLRQMGEWLAVNGEAIYASKPWAYQNDTVNSDVWSVVEQTINSNDNNNNNSKKL